MGVINYRKQGLVEILGLLIIVLAFSIPFASGIHVSGAYNGEVGFSEDITASIDQSFAESTILGEFGVSKTVVGNADLNESHFVANRYGDFAEIGFRILGASEDYTYAYELYPGQGGGKETVEVWATEHLDVPAADYIKAYSNARNRAGYVSGVSTEVSQIGAAKVSLMDYSNLAFASADRAQAGQSIGSASGKIITDTESSTWGSNIIPKGKALDQWSNAVPDARITTTITGSILDPGSTPSYFDSAVKQAGSVELAQDGHITGSFMSTASATGAPDKIRTSNYGTDYDLQMRATKDSSGSATSGILGYYINPDMANLIVGKGAIQGAIDSAQAGDTINMAADSRPYNENVNVGKSLHLIGAGIAATTVDGDTTGDGIGDGTVFTVEPSQTVTLAGMTIQNGMAKYGGGIHNKGTLTLDQVLVTKNHADVAWGMGGGIYNSGDLTLSGVSITKNQAKPANWRYSAGGGGVFNSGTVNMDQGTSITDNIANYGGGIYNLGTVSKTATVNMNPGSSIVDNTASGNNGGGGIYNEYNGIVNMYAGSSITGNKALSSGWQYDGGGIYNGLGCTVNLNGGSIIGNKANYYGGGIYNKGSLYDTTTVNMNDGSVTGNTATINGGGIYNYFGYGTLIGDPGIVYDNIPDQIYDP